MRLKVSLFLIFIIGSIIFSGCLREYDDIYISNIDVMSLDLEEGTRLTVTPYIQNNQNTDSSILSFKVKVRDPSTNTIVAEKDADIGYIKSRSQAFNGVSLLVPQPGDYEIEVQVFEEGRTVTQSFTHVTVKATPGPGQPADIKLTDMNLIIKQFVNGASNAVVDVSPGIYNQGGDSSPLTMEVTARESQYKAYTETDEIGVVRVSDRIRGNVRFVLPRDREYTFTVKVTENGRTVVTANVNEKVKLRDIKYNILKTYALVEEGKPREEEAPAEPGFQVLVAITGLLIVYSIVKRRVR